MTDHPIPPFETQAPLPRAVDHAVIDLLRVDENLGIGELASSLGVTATAVRQRLDRLMRQGLVERSAQGGRRGRPSHVYRLSDAGRRVGGDNFHDLAIVLWREIRGIRDAEVRRGLLNRIGDSLAGMHRDEVQGTTPRDRLHDVAALMRRNDIACVVEDPVEGRFGGKRDGSLPVLTSYACPYPDLAEQDRGICAAERVMIEQLVGRPVRLDECRLDGGSCCRFALQERDEDCGADGRDLRAGPAPRRMPAKRAVRPDRSRRSPADVPPQPTSQPASQPPTSPNPEPVS